MRLVVAARLLVLASPFGLGSYGTVYFAGGFYVVSVCFGLRSNVSMCSGAGS